MRRVCPMQPVTHATGPHSHENICLHATCPTCALANTQWPANAGRVQADGPEQEVGASRSRTKYFQHQRTTRQSDKDHDVKAACARLLTGFLAAPRITRGVLMDWAKVGWAIAGLDTGVGEVEV